MRKQALHILKISLSSYSSSDNSNGHYSSSNSKFVVAGFDEHTSSFTRTSYANITKRDKWADEEAKSLGVGEVCHLSDGCLSSQERWKVFVLLYEMLEEYGTHLVEAAWTHQVNFYALNFRHFSLTFIGKYCACKMFYLFFFFFFGTVSYPIHPLFLYNPDTC